MAFEASVGLFSRGSLAKSNDSKGPLTRLALSIWIGGSGLEDVSAHPPLLVLYGNPPLQAFDLILGSGVPVNLSLSLQSILLTSIRENCGPNGELRL